MPTAKKKPARRPKSLGKTDFGEKILSQGQCCDLIEDDGETRRWRCRGDNTISEEVFDGRRWETTIDHGR